MRAADFERAALAVVGTAVGWQTKIARALDVNPRTVRYWLKAAETPAWVDDALAELMGGLERGPWPRDEWIVGDVPAVDGGWRSYVVHTAPPRFVARLVDTGEDGEPADHEPAADIVSGTVYRADVDRLICEVEWIDTPKAGEVTALMEAAADAAEAVDERAASDLRARPGDEGDDL